MLQYLLDLVIYCVVSCINWIIQTIGDLVGGIISLLPLSPLKFILTTGACPIAKAFG